MLLCRAAVYMQSCSLCKIFVFLPLLQKDLLYGTDQPPAVVSDSSLTELESMDNHSLRSSQQKRILWGI